MGPPVDPLHEVAAIGVALWRRQPLGWALAPARIGADHDVAAVVVPQGQLEQEARVGRGPALAGPVPPVQHADGAVPPAGEHARQVDGAGVLLVGVREARPGVHRRAVDEQPVGVGGGDVGGGAAEDAGRRHDLGAQVGDAVGLCGVARGAQPLGLPVGGPQCRGEPGRRRDRPPRSPLCRGAGPSTRRPRRRRAWVLRRPRRPAGPTARGRCPTRSRSGPGRCGGPRCGRPSAPPRAPVPAASRRTSSRRGRRPRGRPDR